jgi:hypothetical protein
VPEHIDAVIEVPLPARCDRCGGRPELEDVQAQYQAEQALALRDRRDAGSISPQGLAVARGRPETRMDPPRAS